MNPGDQGQSPNRMAEMAAELLGAKLTSEIVREAWASASPDAKREIADALLARIKASIASGGITDTYEVRHFMENLVKTMLDERIADFRQTLDVKIREVVARFTPAYMDQAFQEVINVTMGNVMRRVVREFADEMQKKLMR